MNPASTQAKKPHRFRKFLRKAAPSIASIIVALITSIGLAINTDQGVRSSAALTEAQLKANAQEQQKQATLANASYFRIQRADAFVGLVTANRRLQAAEKAALYPDASDSTPHQRRTAVATALTAFYVSEDLGELFGTCNVRDAISKLNKTHTDIIDGSLKGTAYRYQPAGAAALISRENTALYHLEGAARQLLGAADDPAQPEPAPPACTPQTALSKLLGALAGR